ncbi:MAG: hypothetical protein HN921_12580 [Bacteroidetes bacterium]|nr:hypothetical protein [Bacteroidota bacterium]MBT7040668.1 hypothetical protein [Bacteroidota bacterium]
MSLYRTDPVFNAWDKASGISINENQITDLDHFTTADETDPEFGKWNKTSGIKITESQITDLDHFTTTDETDPIYTAWNKSTGISITESQITDLDHFTNADESDPVFNNSVAENIKAYDTTQWANKVETETDPVYTAWNKSTGISITESQITDLDHFTNADETDPVFNNSVAENITAFDTTYWSSAKTILADTDNDTKIQVEKSADEDIIRFELAGVEKMTLNNNSLRLHSSTKSLIIGDHAGDSIKGFEVDNTFIGYKSGANTSYSSASAWRAVRNTFIGTEAGYSNTIGYSNSFVGYYSGYNNTTAGRNSFLGGFSGRSNTTGDHNCFLGYASGVDNTTGNYNTFSGAYSGANNTLGLGNVCMGMYSNRYNEEGSNNVIIGYSAGKGTSSHSKSGNIFIGYQAGFNDTTDNKLYIENSNSSSPLIYGDFSTNLVRVNGTLDVNNAYQFPATDGTNGQVMTTDGSGAISWTTNSPDVDQIIEGNSKIEVTDAGTGTIAFDIDGTEKWIMNGSAFEPKNTGGSVFIGEGAGLGDDLSNNYNVAVGSHTLKYNTTGNLNTADGYASLHYNTTGSYNIGIGAYANYSNRTGSSNTIIGYQAGKGSYTHNKSGNIFLGHKSGFYEYGDNKLYIANSATTTPLIYGDFATDKVTINDVLKLAPRTSAPSNPSEGELYVNSTNHHIYCYLNGSWSQLD